MNPLWRGVVVSFPKRSIYIVLYNDFVLYDDLIFNDEIGVILWRTCFSTLYLQHYSGTTNITAAIENCVFGFIAKSAVIKYHQLLPPLPILKVFEMVQNVNQNHSEFTCSMYYDKNMKIE